MWQGLGKLRRTPRCAAICVAVALGAGLLVGGGARLAVASDKSPPGMVPYSHPVYRNGKRMLWHGVEVIAVGLTLACRLQSNMACR